MAVIYLSSVDGSDSDNGSTWALAKATLAAAMTAAGAAGTVYVDHSHAESTGAGQTFAGGSSAANLIRVVCVDRTGNPEPPTARATTGAVSSSVNATFTGYAYFYGLTFTNTDGGFPFRLGGSDGSARHGLAFDECELFCNVAIGTSPIIMGDFGYAEDSLVEFINTDLRYAGGDGGFRFDGAQFLWRGGSILGTPPTTLFYSTSIHSCGAVLVGVDLSGFGSGKNLVASGWSKHMRFVDCKLGSSVAIVAGAPTTGVIDVINSDSADTNYRFARHTDTAAETHETTIVRTGGASDGTTTFSRKVVTTASPTKLLPYKSLPIELWNETVGSAITVTIPTVTDNVTLTDAEAWLEVEYLGTSGFPLALFASDRVSDPIFGTPANQASSSETWTTTGLTTPVKQALAVTFTPQEKGIVRVTVCVAKASSTVYYDPKVTVS